MRKRTCLLRARRLASGLTQQELTALVPGAGYHRVSDVERNTCPPNAREILAYRIIFGALPEKLFPGVVSEVEEAVARNAYRLHQKLTKDHSREGAHKRAFLEGVLSRAAGKVRPHGK